VKSLIDGTRDKLTDVIVVSTHLFLSASYSVCAFEAPWADSQTNLIQKAEAGSAEAQSALAILYWYNAHRWGVRKGSEAVEYRKCASWALKAATQGQSSAQVLLGDLYLDGLGVSTDASNAYHWYFLAASNRNNVAFIRMAEFYRRNSSALTNKVEAFAWLLLATNDVSHRLERKDKLRRLQISLNRAELRTSTNRATDVFRTLHARRPP
jgi:TPR repeat protein